MGEIIQFIPKPNRKRYISLERQAKQIMAPYLAHPHEDAVNAVLADEKEPA